MTHLLLLIIYLAFISLGLPDGLLGAAWPTMHLEISAPLSYAGYLNTLISIFTIVSSLLCDRITRKIGTGRFTAISVSLTAVALWGFSMSDSYWRLLLWAIPYGLGAGGVDASLNNYVAIHYASRHMSWLHCMWGLGATIGPWIMSWALTGGQGWQQGYSTVALIQVALTAALVFSLPLWKPHPATQKAAEKPSRPLTIRETLAIPGAKALFITFFGYCGLETTAGLWASSYLIAHSGFSPTEAAALAGLFYTGITVGRGVSGFVTLKLNDTQMVRLGLGIIGGGLALMLLPLGKMGAQIGLVLVGLGCAPIYPCVVHSTPIRFGAERSQSIIGIQMACAYVGSCTMSPLFGIIANGVTPLLLPVFLCVMLALMVVMHERLARTTNTQAANI